MQGPAGLGLIGKRSQNRKGEKSHDDGSQSLLRQVCIRPATEKAVVSYECLNPFFVRSAFVPRGMNKGLFEICLNPFFVRSAFVLKFSGECDISLGLNPFFVRSAFVPPGAKNPFLEKQVTSTFWHIIIAPATLLRSPRGRCPNFFSL